MRRNTHIPPPLIALSLALLVNLLIIAIPQTRIIALKSIFLSALFFLTSGTLAGWSILVFLKNHTTLNPNEKPNTLVVSGPYKLSRNPMYLGLLLLLTSYSFWRGMAIFYLAPIAFYLIMDRYVIPNEERIIRETIGGKYDIYTKSVKRWL
jgi:protein-S-isoprenylcysteine O-methyltransferase Ste14